MARFRVEAEFNHVSPGISVLLWMKIVLDDLKIKVHCYIKLFCDNKSVISIAHNLVQHCRIKHFKIKRHFMKVKLDSGVITRVYIPFIH